MRTLSAIRDPRHLQIGFLCTFLGFGLLSSRLDIGFSQALLITALACTTQWAFMRLYGVTEVGYLSAAVTSLGLSLLVRADSAWILALAAIGAIASKFLIRFRGKHLFNPTNFGLAGAMGLTAHAWCSPSQWGEGTGLLAWFFILGLAVAHRAFRSDISLAFLGFWFLLKLGRVLYLGQPMPVLFHQLNVGSLILFSFFMISDPKTTPNHRFARILFAGSVALLAFILQHHFWWQNGPVWALFFLSPLVPVLDALFVHHRFIWPQERNTVCRPEFIPSPVPRSSSPPVS